MEFIDPEWQDVLQQQGLGSFDSIWNRELQLIDRPNRARGGWSEVGCHELGTTAAGIDTLYVKRQQNFTYRDWPHVFQPRPTLYREYCNLSWCLQHAIPVARPLAYLSKKVNGNQMAVLITAGLKDYWPLSDVERWNALQEEHRKQVLQAIALVVYRMHDGGMQHGCFYPKHIFIHEQFFTAENREICLIDLEKGRFLSWWNGGRFRDLDTFFRRAGFLTAEERKFFFDEYYRWENGDKGALFARLQRSLDRRSQ